MSADLMRSELLEIWNLREALRVIDMGNNYFIFRVNNIDDRLQVLTSSPWELHGKYLALSKAIPFFRPSEEHCTADPIWIRLTTTKLCEGIDVA